MAIVRTTPLGARAVGRCAVNPTCDLANIGWGKYQVYNTYSNTGTGKYMVSFRLYENTGKGAYGVMRKYENTARGLYRVADDNVSQYELYRGVDERPDLTASPWETFTSSPHETAALAAGHTYYFVLMERNEYNEVSQVYDEWTVEIDGAGDQVAARPAEPFDISIDPAASGAVRVQASYNYIGDDSNSAVDWLIYITSNGVDPDPAIDSPTVVDMVKNESLEFLDWTSGNYADGLTIKVLVRTRRIDAGPVNIDSQNTTIYSTTSDTDGPSAPDGDIFFKDDNMQQQHGGAVSC